MNQTLLRFGNQPTYGVPPIPKNISGGGLETAFSVTFVFTSQHYFFVGWGFAVVQGQNRLQNRKPNPANQILRKCPTSIVCELCREPKLVSTISGNFSVEGSRQSGNNIRLKTGAMMILLILIVEIHSRRTFWAN